MLMRFLLPGLGGLTRLAVKSGNGVGPSAPAGERDHPRESEYSIIRFMPACFCYACRLDLGEISHKGGFQTRQSDGRDGDFAIFSVKSENHTNDNQN